MKSYAFFAILWVYLITLFANGTTENECPICYEIIKNHTIILPCTHTLCFACFANCVFEEIHNCPICRDTKFLQILTNHTSLFISEILSKQNLLESQEKFDNIFTVCISHANFELCDYLFTTYGIIRFSDIPDEFRHTLFFLLIQSNFTSSEIKFKFFKTRKKTRKISPMVKNVHQETILHCALLFAQTQIANYLLEKKLAHINEQDEDLNTPILFLIASRYYESEFQKLEQLKYLIEIEKGDFLKINYNQISPLHASINMGHFNIFVYLFELVKQHHIITPNIVSHIMTRLGQTEDEKLEFVKFILANTNITVYSSNSEGQPFFHLCSYFGYLKILKYFSNFIDIDFPDKLGNSALFYVISSSVISEDKKFELLNFFICEKSANVNLPNFKKATPFYMSITLGNIKLVEYFVKHTTPNVNVLDCEHHNALMQVILTEDIETEDEKLDLTKYLLENTNPELQNKYTSMMHLCAHYGYKKIIKFFIFSFYIFSQNYLHESIVVFTI
jgi:ankyrin repeat protein